MSNFRLKRIDNANISILCKAVAKHYGFKTIGKFNDFLQSIPSPNAKLSYLNMHTRVSRIRKEINELIKSQ
jgi:hypothetical protein